MRTQRQMQAHWNPKREQGAKEGASGYQDQEKLGEIPGNDGKIKGGGDSE